MKAIDMSYLWTVFFMLLAAYYIPGIAEGRPILLIWYTWAVLFAGINFGITTERRFRKRLHTTNESDNHATH